jgi:A/G-specific adenine glycosylase
MARQIQIPNSLLKWFRANARDLPWRHDRSPYRVWLSEMMLQQTQVETVIPYFHRFLNRFPTLDDLAAAPLGDVLKLWEGLGYYARARNLHKAAHVIVEELHGEWPRTVEGLMALPGIGRYTAGAIASLAFDVDAPVLDGNVKRVLSRLFAIGAASLRGGHRPTKQSPVVRMKIASLPLAMTEKEMWSLAEELVPHRQAGEYNEALMELGALICTPRNPKCDVCPLAKYCEANKRGLQDQLPIKTKRKPLPHFDVTAAVIRKNGRLLIAQRPLGGRLGGLWEFPGGKVEPGETLPQCLRREIKEELGVRIKVGKRITSIDHAYTHFKITLHAFECELVSGKPQALQVEDFKWARMSELQKYAFAKTDLRIIEALRARSTKGTT